MRTSVVLSLVALATALPVDKFHRSKNTVSRDGVTELHNELLNAAYKHNFKVLLTDYVLSVHRNLTFDEQDTVKAIIEDFLHNLTKDFRTILNNEDDTDALDTRIGDPVFDEIVECIISEIPDIDECKAIKLANKIVDNLVQARKRIDRFIKESNIASILNSPST